MFPNVHPEPLNSQPLPFVVLFSPTEKYFVPIATACQVVAGISWSCCSFLGMKIIQGEQWTFLFLFFFPLYLSIPFLGVLLGFPSGNSYKEQSLLTII